MVTFDKRKKDFLAKIDKSNIGRWDRPIADLCNRINENNDYYTLSSCSGRIVLLKNIVEKKPNLFIFRKHDLVNLSEIKKAIENYKEDICLTYKQEPCILHVACRDLGSAKNLLILGQEAGWKNSGIIAVSDNRIVVDLRSTETINFPIYENKKILVNDEFLEFVIKESNQKLKRTWKKIEKLCQKL